MVYVSVSAFDDGDLLAGALDSVRAHLPEATVEVIDGAYSTFPRESDASTDDTPAVCDAFDATHHVPPDLPFDREVDKHRYRVSRAPAGEWSLFLDADERLAMSGVDALDPGRAYAVRIHNPVVYSESPIRFWPRCFFPEHVQEVSRWDKYLFSVPCDRTDAVSITHRHDLRDRAYREAKYERFDREGRAGRYAESFDQYLADDWDVETATCPACGRDSVVTAPATREGRDTFSALQVCVAGDGCYRDVETFDVGAYRYLPDGWRRGLREAPARLRVELIDAGCPFVGMTDFTTVRQAGRLDEIAPAIKLWIEDAYERDPGEARVFDTGS